MLRQRASACTIIMISIIGAGCTTSGEVYNSKKHSRADFSTANTLAAIGGTVLAAAVIIAVAKNGGGGGYRASDYDYAWDYLPASAQWACRGKQTGQFAYQSNCQFDPVNDYTWPG